MRYAFERQKVTKEQFMAHMREELSCDFVNIETAQRKLVQFCKESKVALSDRDSWTVFLYCEKSIDGKLNIAKMAECLFDESEQQFVERNLRASMFSQPQPLDIVKGPISSSTLVLPPIVKELEQNQYYQRKNHFDLFKKVDADGDGKISRQDLVNFVNKGTHPALPETQIQALLQHFDLNTKSHLGYADFYSKLYFNIQNAELQENNTQTNILSSKQFDHNAYKENYQSVKQKINEITDMFRLKSETDNCILNRLLHSQPVQIHPGVPEHLRQPQTASKQRSFPGLLQSS